MKLNHECVRAVLLFLEENLKDFGIIYSPNINISNFEYSDIIYSIKKLSEAGYITIDSITLDNTTTINGITWDGHLFLDNIRNENVWNNVLNKVKSTVGSASIEILSKVAFAYLSSQLGI